MNQEETNLKYSPNYSPNIVNKRNPQTSKHLPRASSVLLLFSGERDNLLPFIFVFIIFIPYGILHYKTAMQMKQIKKGKELNIILAQTARNMLIYGIATTIALVGL